MATTKKDEKLCAAIASSISDTLKLSSDHDFRYNCLSLLRASCMNEWESLMEENLLCMIREVEKKRANTNSTSGPTVATVIHEVGREEPEPKPASETGPEVAEDVIEMAIGEELPIEEAITNYSINTCTLIVLGPNSEACNSNLSTGVLEIVPAAETRDFPAGDFPTNFRSENGGGGGGGGEDFEVSNCEGNIAKSENNEDFINMILQCDVVLEGAEGVATENGASRLVENGLEVDSRRTEDDPRKSQSSSSGINPESSEERETGLTDNDEDTLFDKATFEWTPERCSSKEEELLANSLPGGGDSSTFSDDSLQLSEDISNWNSPVQVTSSFENVEPIGRDNNENDLTDESWWKWSP